MGARRVVAVVPARDEEETVGAVVRGLLAHGVDRVVVCDDASRDRTARAAAAAGAEVVREEERGYGAACLAALRRAGDADVVLFCDADGSSDPAEAPRLLEAVGPAADGPAAGGADLAVGARRRVLPGAMTPPQRLGTSLAVRLIRLLWGAPVTDIGPFRAIRRTALDRLGMRDRTWGWTVEMQIRAIEEGLRTVEVPVSFLPRTGGRSKISGTVRGVVAAGAKILWTIARHRCRPGRPGRSGRRWALAAAAAGGMVAGLLIALPLSVVVGAPPAAVPPAPRPPSAKPAIRGVAYALHPVRGAEPVRAVGEIAGLGATAVEIVVPFYQRDVGDTAPGPRAGRTPEPAAIRAALRAARERNLRAWVLPVVLLEAPGEDGWRGVIAPADTAAWWRSYRGVLVGLARLAAEEGAEGLAVGSELLSREADRAEWIETIRAVRGVFPGLLTYSANWDRYEPVPFWDALDVVGVSAYFEVGRENGAGAAALRAAWGRERDRLLAFARRAGRPLLLTEVGYPALDGGAAYPWDYTRDAPEDAAEQATALGAFVEAWRGTDAPFLGAFVYEWDEPARTSAYSPRDRPAEAAVRDFCRGGS